MEGRWGRNDLIPMWVADMDFRTAPFVIDALKKRLEHEVLGYTFACKEWAESIINWLKERHGWTISEDMLTFTPGIVRGLAFAIHCFTEKGDKVMVHLRPSDPMTTTQGCRTERQARQYD